DPRWKPSCLIAIVLAVLVTATSPQGIVANETYTLHWACINGQNVTQTPVPLVNARLGSTLVINACWDLLYDPYEENCCVEFELYNNASFIARSPSYFENNITQIQGWNVFLNPSDWTMENRAEYGRIIIKYSSSLGFSNLTVCPILVLPEQLECYYASHVLETDGGGRMYFMNVSFHVKSIQDPSRVVTSAPFVFELRDLAGNVVHTWAAQTDANGNIHAILNRDVLFDLEKYWIRTNHVQTSHADCPPAEVYLEDLVTRDDLTCTVTGMSAIEGDALFAASISFLVETAAIIFDDSSKVIYYSWNVSDSFPTMVDQGSGFAILDTGFSIKVKKELLPRLEALTICLMVEGNFLVRGVYLKVNLCDIFNRDAILVEVMNIYAIQDGNANNILLHASNASSGSPVAFKQFTITWMHVLNASIFTRNQAASDENGNVCLVPDQWILDDIESYSVCIDAGATIDFIPVHVVFTLDALFSRDVLGVSCFSQVENINLSFFNFFTFQCQLMPPMYSFANFSSINVRVEVLDASNRTVFLEDIPVHENGTVAAKIPARSLSPWTNYSIHVIMNSTFKYKTVMACFMIEIDNIDGREQYVYDTVLLYAILGSSSVGSILCVPFCYKKIKYKKFSKKNFTVSIT
nr:hypothetical protein [Candidatus Sigynarchaeota archaeon]